MSFYCSCAPSLVAWRAGHERVFILFCNICISSYFGWCFSCCTFQPPTVSQCGYAGTEVLSVGRVSGSAGPQFNNCARGPFCGPRDPEGPLCSWYYQVYQLQYVETCCTTSSNVKMLCILPAEYICIILWFLEQRTNSSLHHRMIRVYNQNCTCICSVWTIYLTVIQLCIRVGRVKFMMRCSGRFL